MTVVERTLRDAMGRRSHGLLSFGSIGGLLAASNGVVTLIDTPNTAYDVKERRPYWKVWVIAITLTVGLSLLVAEGAALIVFADRLSPWLSQWIARAFNLGWPILVLWRVASYVLSLPLFLISIEGAYYFGPDIVQKWRWITPGAVFDDRRVGDRVSALLLLSESWAQLQRHLRQPWGGRCLNALALPDRISRFDRG